VVRVARSKPKGRGACPSFFCALCLTASAGGRNGYENAGYGLAPIFADPTQYDFGTDEEYVEAARDLVLLVNEREDEGILCWLEEYFPRCLALVPDEDRQEFLNGIYRHMLDEDGIAKLSPD
jgi:hypothetical protein